MITIKNIREKAQEHGYIRNNFEKNFRLIEILKNIQTDPILQKDLVLKGGAATNLIHSRADRLFLDIDVDYAIPSSEADMQEERKVIRSNLLEIMRGTEYELSPKSRFHYALDSFSFKYVDQGGNIDYVKLDINYSLRNHILDSTISQVKSQDFEVELEIHTLNNIELLGTKIKALIQRGKVKDLYDVYKLLSIDVSKENLDLLRKIILFYEVISSSYNRFNSVGYIEEGIKNMDERGCRKELYSIIQKQSHFSLERAKKEVLDSLKNLLVFTKQEQAFANHFYEGEYHPELLFQKEEYLQKIKTHPMATWKIQNKNR